MKLMLVFLLVLGQSVVAQTSDKPQDPPKVVIAMVDSGIDTENADLMKMVWVNPNEKSNGKDDDNNGCDDDVRGCNVFNRSGIVQDDRGHGTYVAAVLAGKSNLTKNIFSKISSDIKIFPIRAMVASPVFVMEKNRAIVSSYDTMDVRGSWETIAKAIYCVRETKKKSGANFIINASLSSRVFYGNAKLYEQELKQAEEDKKLFEAELKKAEEEGILIVISAGNEGENHALMYPASLKLPNMITVGAINYGKFAYYSCKGADIAADGTNVPGLGEGYAQYMRGTSFAAPVVALVAAEVWSRHPELTAVQVKAIILETADVADYLNGKVEGNRLLNFEKAISK